MEKLKIDKKLAPNLAARRERIILTALELIRAPAGTNVQMREIAEQTPVALGTLYRYFPSRQELLSHAYERWRDECLQNLVKSGAIQGHTNAERLGNVTKRDFQFLVDEPNFCEISSELARASNPRVVTCMRRIREKTYEVYMQSIKEMEQVDALSVTDILATVMEAQAILYGIGRTTADAAFQAMDRCIYMLLLREADSPPDR